MAEGAANATVQVCYEGQRREPYNSRKPYSSVRIKTYNLLTASLGLRTEQCVLEAPAAGGGGGRGIRSSTRGQHAVYTVSESSKNERI